MAKAIKGIHFGYNHSFHKVTITLAAVPFLLRDSWSTYYIQAIYILFTGFFPDQFLGVKIN